MASGETPADERLDMAINETHQYACKLLAYAVERPFNGDTDYDVVAVFDSNWDAIQYAEYRNKQEQPAYPYRVVNVGTLNRDRTGLLVR